MNGYNFTERVRRTLAQAREEAIELDHEFVGTEHILLALLHDHNGCAAAVLDALDAKPDAIRADILRVLQSGRPRAGGPDLPYTSRGKKVLELAMAEARELNHAYVGTEHLLLGLLREENGIAAQALVAAGVTLTTARTATLRFLGNPAPDTPPDAMRASNRVVIPRRSPEEAGEHVAWMRLSRALDACQRLGTPPTLTLEDDGSLTVPLGPDLVVSVQFPARVRLRRGVAHPDAGGATSSEQERA